MKLPPAEAEETDAPSSGGGNEIGVGVSSQATFFSAPAPNWLNRPWPNACTVPASSSTRECASPHEADVAFTPVSARERISRGEFPRVAPRDAKRANDAYADAKNVFVFVESSGDVSPPCPRHPSKSAPHVYTAPFAVSAMLCRAPAASATTGPRSSPPGASGESDASHRGVGFVSSDGAAPSAVPHCETSFRPNAHTSPPNVRHSVWKCPAAAATTGSCSGRPSTLVGVAANRAAPKECPSCPKSFRPHVYTAPSAPTSTVCAPPADAATASTGSRTR